MGKIVRSAKPRGHRAARLTSVHPFPGRGAARQRCTADPGSSKTRPWSLGAWGDHGSAAHHCACAPCCAAPGKRCIGNKSLSRRRDCDLYHRRVDNGHRDCYVASHPARRGRLSRRYSERRSGCGPAGAAIHRPPGGVGHHACRHCDRRVRCLLDWDRRRWVTPIRTTSQEAWPDAEP